MVQDKYTDVLKRKTVGHVHGKVMDAVKRMDAIIVKHSKQHNLSQFQRPCELQDYLGQPSFSEGTMLTFLGVKSFDQFLQYVISTGSFGTNEYMIAWNILSLDHILSIAGLDHKSASNYSEMMKNAMHWSNWVVIPTCLNYLKQSLTVVCVTKVLKQDGSLMKYALVSCSFSSSK